MGPMLRLYAGATSVEPSRFSSTVWRWWAITVALLVAAAIAFFLVYEFWVLAHGRPQDTLSAQVWRLLQVAPGPVSGWSAVRVLSLITWLTAWTFIDLLVIWLTGHFWIGWWR